MGDEIRAKGQIGALGRNAKVEHTTFNQIWHEGGESVDLSKLAEELSAIRKAMRAESSTAEQDVQLGLIAAAETAAKSGDGPGVFGVLSKVGPWAIEAATKIGAGLAVAIISKATGLSH